MEKIYKLSYKDNKNANIIMNYFINKYKKRCKVIYLNKIYELDKIDKFPLLLFNNNDSIKFKILSFVDLQDFKTEMENSNLLDIKEKYRSIKINSDILPKNLIFNIFKMEYKINKEENIKIFGKDFVKNNSDKCLIIYRNKILPLDEYLKYEIEDKLEILLIDFGEIVNKGFIFRKYNILKEKKNEIKNNLFSLEKSEKIAFDINKENKEINLNENFNLIDEFLDKNFKNRNDEINKNYENIIIKNKPKIKSNSKNGLDNMLSLLKKYIITKDFSNDKNKNTTNIYSLFADNSSSIFSVTNDMNEGDLFFNEEYYWEINDITLNHLFNGYTKLYSLLDKNKFLTNKIKDMSYMFHNCTSLISFKDLSKWNINKITGIKCMFYNCSSLISLPDIFRWNTEEITDMSSLFNGCTSLISLPNISKWNTNKVKDMSNLFKKCSSLISLPDISKWNITNVKDLSGIFNGCSSLISLPNISKWNTRNVTDIHSMFKKCSSLICLNISEWKTENIINMNKIFYGCSSLRKLSNISKWNTNNVKDISEMFSGCSSLIHLLEYL